MKLTNIKSSTYIAFGVKNNDKDLKFKVDGYTSDWPEEAFVIKKVKKYLTVGICNRGS